VWVPWAHTASAATSATIRGLANGTGYFFRVKAVNQNGSGITVETSSAVVPMMPPTSLTGRAGNGLAVLTWLPPRVVGPRRIIDYRVQYSADGGATWLTANDGVSASSRATVRGLTNGISYIFRVAAITSQGIGAFSANSLSLRPRR
jgi:hypothetical protein